jgi:drug/metabolite transporter (DMT)-like permease
MPDSWVWLAIGGSIALTIGTVSVKWSREQGVDPYPLNMMMRIMSALVAVVVTVVYLMYFCDQDVEPDKNATWVERVFPKDTFWPCVVGGIGYGLSSVMFLLAVYYAPNIGYPASLGLVHLVLITGISIMFFGSKFNASALMGMGLIVGGALVLNLNAERE